jgi:hypothetical protein
METKIALNPTKHFNTSAHLQIALLEMTSMLASTMVVYFNNLIIPRVLHLHYPMWIYHFDYNGAQPSATKLPRVIM